MPDNKCKKLEATAIIIAENLIYDPQGEIIRKVKKPELTDAEILAGINYAKKLLFKKGLYINNLISYSGAPVLFQLFIFQQYV